MSEKDNKELNEFENVENQLLEYDNVGFDWQNVKNNDDDLKVLSVDVDKTYNEYNKIGNKSKVDNTYESMND